MKQITLLDGAMGTQLHKKGFTGGCAEVWSLEHPDAVLAIQRAYVDAGTQILYTPTFGANRPNLERGGLKGGTVVEDFNRRLVAISKEAADGKAFLAGDVSPTGLMPEPFGDYSEDELTAIISEQIKALLKAGVDMFAVETMVLVSEARAAVKAVKSLCSLPIILSFTCNEKGRTLYGDSLEDALQLAEDENVYAIGLNCSNGPSDMLPLLEQISKTGTTIPLLAKPNAGKPQLVGGETVYNMDPATFASYAPAMRDCGVRFFGGCCGTDELCIAALREQLF